jgi:hypothetical protein
LKPKRAIGAKEMIGGCEWNISIFKHIDLRWNQRECLEDNTMNIAIPKTRRELK